MFKEGFIKMKEEKPIIEMFNKVGLDELGLIVEFQGVKYSGCLSELQFKEVEEEPNIIENADGDKEWL